MDDLMSIATQHVENGNFSAAILVYKRLIISNPKDLIAHTLLAESLIANQKAHQALDLIRDLEFDSINVTEIKRNLATVQAKALLAIGDKYVALRNFRSIAYGYPEWPDGWNNLACCLIEVGREQEAVVQFKKAHAIDRLHINSVLGLAKIYKSHEQYELAQIILEDYLGLINSSRARAELVTILIRRSNLVDALQHAQKIGAIPDASLEHIMLLARVHFLMGNIEGYLNCLGNVPDQIWKGVSTSSLMIGTLAETGAINEAKSKLDNFINLNPIDANARLVRARDLLSKGDFENGWKEYTFRLRLPANQIHFGITPNWDGQRFKFEKPILVLGEQGIGDICYFSRFLHPLLKDNSFCSLICEPRIHQLLEPSFPKLNIFSDPNIISILPEPLVKIPIGSLPLLYGTTVDAIVSSQPSLHARYEDIKTVNRLLKRDALNKKILGISLLAGRPSDEFQQRKRSIPFEPVLRQLAGLNITLVDLQHLGHSNNFYEEAKLLGIQVLSYPQLTENLSMLLAMITTLDGVITAQQSNAHLCGAVGQKGIVILPPASHFVYGHGSRSIWYPQLQLIRSFEWNNWDCIEQVLPAELDSLLQ